VLFTDESWFQLYRADDKQPDQLYAKEMCRAAWGKWSHQILTGFLIYAPTFF
jgi:hypothetical protein